LRGVFGAAVLHVDRTENIADEQLLIACHHHTLQPTSNQSKPFQTTSQMPLKTTIFSHARLEYEGLVFGIKIIRVLGRERAATASCVVTLAHGKKGAYKNKMKKQTKNKETKPREEDRSPTKTKLQNKNKTNNFSLVQAWNEW
jgi:hypothetical protein